MKRWTGINNARNKPSGWAVLVAMGLGLAVVAPSGMSQEATPGVSSGQGQGITETRPKVGGSSQPGQGTWAMDQAFTEHKYEVVQALSTQAGNERAGNEQEIIGNLTKWAEKGSVPAMWLLSQKLYDSQQEQASADWLYTALLGTRLDMATCANSEVYNVGKKILNSYWQPATAARKYPEIMSRGIDFSVQFFSNNGLTTYDPHWVCRLTPKVDQQQGDLPARVALDRRKTVYQLYLKDTNSQDPKHESTQQQGDLNSQEMLHQLQSSGDRQP